MRKKKAAAFALAAGLCLTISGCQRTSQTGQQGQVSSEAGTDLSETQTEGRETAESKGEAPETEENLEETTEEETQAKAGEEPRYEIVLATDIHYLAEDLAGNRCQSFINYVYGGDGRVLLYSWEILDAFIEDMKEKEPDLLLLSGDLTLNGEKASHQELVSLLEELEEEGIQTLVIPGNHDINNPNAKKFSGMNSYPVDSITAEEFEDIYGEFGYAAADSRDPDSLSYLYKVDSSLWLLMLDSCQYDPVNQVGGMIQGGTYKWMEPLLYEAWENGTEVITVSHHNLLEQSGVSDAFYDDCTIEHSEELLQMLFDNEVRLHLSGHLHLQHYMEEDDVAEVVTGSLVMAPCRYGVVDLYEDDSITYHTETVNVEKWAREHSYKNPDLADFFRYSENFLHQISYEHAVSDLERQNRKGILHLSDDEIELMSQFYAKLCVFYYGGKMYEIADEVREDPAAEMWDKYQYASELSDFLRRILEDEAKDFGKLYLD